MAGLVSTSPTADVSAIKAKTDLIPSDPADESLIEAAITAAHGTTDALVTTVDGVVDAVKAQTDKLAGETPVDDTTTANWQSGTATSTETGGDLVTLGTVSVWKKLHSLIVDISALTAAATITVRLYKLVNGAERGIYNQDFVKGVAPDGLWIVNGTLVIYGQVRVEVQSNNASDNGSAVAYEYDLEDM